MVVAGAAVAGISCAVYTGIRSAYDLYDRKYHKQSIALKDREARASWFNIAAGTLSAGAAGATQLITQAAQSGQNISHLTRNTVRFMNVGALSLHTTGCLDGFHTMLYSFYNGEPISKVHLAQLSASLFLLTHSISNFQAAEQLMRNSDSTNPDSMKAMLCERQKLSFDHLVNETALIRGMRTNVGQIIVRSFKSLGDPKELLRYIEMHSNAQQQNTQPNDEPTVEAAEATELKSPTSESGSESQPLALPNVELVTKQEDFCVGVYPAVATEYVELFDSHLESIVSKLQQQIKNGDATALKTILVHLLDELTMKVFNKLLNFTQELMVRVSNSMSSRLKSPLNFPSFLKMVHAQFVERSCKEPNPDLNAYILSLDEDKLQFIDFQIRDYLSNQSADYFTELDTNYDAAHTYKTDLSESRKVYLLIGERVDEFSSKFEMCCATANANELRETIEEILKRLSYGSATIFFALAKQLLNSHALNIQVQLSRFISVDIFITDIFCLLAKISADDCDSLNEFLFQYTDDLYDKIETEFKQNYVVENEEKKTLCSICAGEAFAE